MNHDEQYKEWTSSDVSCCIIRVTNQCDQKCKHCCFRSGPNRVGQMSVETCKKLNSWISQDIRINIMGGEFTILPDYPEMVIELARSRRQVRLVTNGYWSRDLDKFLNTLQQIKKTCPQLTVAISTDRWHEKLTDQAILLLKKFDSKLVDIDAEMGLSKDRLAPVGRTWDNGLRSEPHKVRACEELCCITITEDGMISRCPFGYFPWKHFSETTWHDAQEYIWGWRSEKLSDGMNCHSCMECDAMGRTR